MGDGQDDNDRFAILNIMIESKILLRPCVGASFHGWRPGLGYDDGVIEQTAHFAAVALAGHDSGPDF